MRTTDKELNDRLWPELQSSRATGNVPDKPRQLIGTRVPIRGSNASWGSTALPPPGSEERNSYPPAKIGGWRRWQTKNQDLEWAHRSYILFATTNDSDFTGLASRNVAYVGIPGLDGEIEWDWFFFYRNPASLLRQINARLDRLDEMQSRGAGARDGRGTCPLVPISSKYASMEEACAAAGITVAEAMHLGASLRAIIAMKLPAAMEEVGVRMNRGTLTKAIEMVPDLFFQHLQRLVPGGEHGPVAFAPVCVGCLLLRTWAVRCTHAYLAAEHGLGCLRWGASFVLGGL